MKVYIVFEELRYEGSRSYPENRRIMGVFLNKADAVALYSRSRFFAMEEHETR